MANTGKAKPRPHGPHRHGATTLRVTEPTRLLTFLRARLPDEGRNSIKAMLAHHQVTVDGQAVSWFDHPLAPGQRVVIERGRTAQDAFAASGQRAERGEAAAPRGLRILFEDEHLIVIDKEAGLLSIATERERERTAYRILGDLARAKDPAARIFVVHRLDRESSGVMLFAKHEAAKRRLQDRWHDEVEERVYAVVVEGRVADSEGTITSWLREDRSLVMRSSPTDNGGQRAVTHYRVKRRGRDCTLLEVSLETGRKNQIRAHMQSIGHSVVGDAKYGAASDPIGRLALHAQTLSFRHPMTGQSMHFTSPPPRSFLRLVGSR